MFSGSSPGSSIQGSGEDFCAKSPSPQDSLQLYHQMEAREGGAGRDGGAELGQFPVYWYGDFASLRNDTSQKQQDSRSIWKKECGNPRVENGWVLFGEQYYQPQPVAAGDRSPLSLTTNLLFRDSKK